MPQALPFPIRKECPPGACECGRDDLLQAWDRAPDDTDIRVLRLTRDQEKVVIERIESVATYELLGHLKQRIQEQLGVTLTITPSANGVSTVMGLSIKLVEQPGLCRRTRENLPAAVRRCFRNHPEIVYALLNARDLLGAEEEA
jgi:Trp operon repressor